jgi:hypothetical protein
MDVICFLSVSLGSSSDQLLDSLGNRRACSCSEAGFSSQMATVIEECNTKDQNSVVCFLSSKGLNEKDIHKEMFPFYGVKCLSRKAVHNWIEKFS